MGREGERTPWILGLLVFKSNAVAQGKMSLGTAHRAGGSPPDIWDNLEYKQERTSVELWDESAQA